MWKTSSSCGWIQIPGFNLDLEFSIYFAIFEAEIVAVHDVC